MRPYVVRRSWSLNIVGRASPSVGHVVARRLASYLSPSVVIDFRRELAAFPDHQNLEIFLSVNTPTHSAVHDGVTAAGSVRPAIDIKTDETKAAFKTTEFVVYLVAVAGVLLASNLVGDADGRGDVFLADKAWFYVTLLTIGYMVSRGLAKSGSRNRNAA